MDHGRIGRGQRLRPGLAIAGDRAVDETRIGLAQRGEVQPEPRHDAGPEIFHQYVAGRNQILDEGDDFGGFKVAGDALLARVQIAEIGAEAIPLGRPRADLVAIQRFHLDDFGAQVGQHPRRERPGHDAGEIQHPHAIQGANRRRLALFRHSLTRLSNQLFNGPTYCTAVVGRQSRTTVQLAVSNAPVRRPARREGQPLAAALLFLRTWRCTRSRCLRISATAASLSFARNCRTSRNRDSINDCCNVS